MEENKTQFPQEANDGGVTLVDLWRILRKYFWRILILTLIFTAIETVAVKFLVKPTYTATASIIMNPGLLETPAEGADTSATTSANLTQYNNYYVYSTRMLSSITTFIKKSQKVSNDVRAKAQDQANYPNVESVNSSNITVTTGEDQLQIYVSYKTTTSAKAARATVVALVESACEVSKTQENGQYIYLWANTLHVDDLPQSDPKPVNNWYIYTIIAFVLLFVIFFGYYIIVALTDDTVKSKREIEEMTGFNVMAYIDEIDPEKVKKNAEAAASSGKQGK